MAFNVANFRVSFPEFQSVTVYPDLLLNANYQESLFYFSNDNLEQAKQDKIYDLLTAHLTSLYNSPTSNSSGGNGIVKSTSIDKVSVTLETPKSKNDFSFWLNQTKYGMRLLALLKILSVGGGYVSSRPAPPLAYDL